VTSNLPHNGTPTSRAAAESMRPHAAIIRERIVQFIAGRGLEGATCDEVEQALGLSHQCASARLNELHAPRQGKPLAFDSGRTRPTRSGRKAVVWVVDTEPRQMTLMEAI